MAEHFDQRIDAEEVQGYGRDRAAAEAGITGAIGTTNPGEGYDVRTRLFPKKSAARKYIAAYRRVARTTAN